MAKAKPIPDNIEELVRDVDYKVRAAAVRESGNSRNLEAIPYILSVMDDKTVTVRAKAGQALKKFYGKDDRIVPSLIVLCADTHGVHKWIHNFLVEKGEAIAPDAVNMLNHSDPEVRKTCLLLLVIVKPDALLPFIQPMLQDQDEGVRQMVKILPDNCAMFGHHRGYADILREEIKKARK